MEALEEDLKEAIEISPEEEEWYQKYKAKKSKVLE